MSLPNGDIESTGRYSSSEQHRQIYTAVRSSNLTSFKFYEVHSPRKKNSQQSRKI